MNKVLRHRLRNIASGMKNALTLLSRDLESRLQPEEQEYFPLMLRECGELVYMTDRMSLLFDEVLPGEPAAANDILEQSLSELRSRFPTSIIRVEAEPDIMASLLPARKWCAQIFTELLANAVESRPDSDVTIRMASCEAMGFRFEVADQGKGISPEQADFIFTPFFTLRPRRLGLGLAIARRLSDRMGCVLGVARNMAGDFAMEWRVPALVEPAIPAEDVMPRNEERRT